MILFPKLTPVCTGICGAGGGWVAYIHTRRPSSVLKWKDSDISGKIPEKILDYIY